MEPIDLLNNPSWKHISIVLERVTFQAYKDERLKVKTRTGYELCNLFLSQWRGGHVRLLSTVYNKSRWTFQLGNDIEISTRPESNIS